jgi:hypothetical protein
MKKNQEILASAHPRERRELLPWQQPKATEEDPEALRRVQAILDSPSYRRADDDITSLVGLEARWTVNKDVLRLWRLGNVRSCGWDSSLSSRGAVEDRVAEGAMVSFSEGLIRGTATHIVSKRAVHDGPSSSSWINAASAIEGTNRGSGGSNIIGIDSRRPDARFKSLTSSIFVYDNRTDA